MSEDDRILWEINESMAALAKRGFVLPIAWTLASYADPSAVVLGHTDESAPPNGFETIAHDRAALATMRLPAHLTAIDAVGRSITGMLPEEDGTTERPN